jgi:hypothetical protein
LGEGKLLKLPPDGRSPAAGPSSTGRRIAPHVAGAFSRRQISALHVRADFGFLFPKLLTQLSSEGR